MLSFYDRPQRLCDGLSRREWLRVGGLSALGLSLPALIEARQATAAAATAGGGKARSCIVLFMLGGPAQHETWDPKPEAPVEIRGALKPIDTNVPGLQVGELMPNVARVADKICVLRALSSNDNAHSSSGYWMLTGTPHQPTNSENATPGPPNNWPCLGAVVKHMRPERAGLPSAVTLPENIWNTGNIPWPGQDAGWLGRAADPWLMMCDPSTSDFQVPGLGLPAEVPSSRFLGRQSLLGAVDERFRGARAVAGYDSYRQQVCDLLAAPQARQAFQIDQEPDAVRDRYGRNRFGQSVLLARRLVEAGVSLVQVNWTRHKEDTAASPAWDTHQKNEYHLKRTLMPTMDLAYSALLEDLSQRGMLDETLVVWVGEFGRSPKINGAAGRDHWGYVFSGALAGGGIRGGQVIGASDAIGGYPKEGRVEPHDVSATIFHSLGLSAAELHDPLGRPMVISRGDVIKHVF
jgi:hypothetical protein